MSTLWLRALVVPHMIASKHIQEGVALVLLALPILWGCFEVGMTNRFPPQMRNIIQQAYSAIRETSVEDGENPVKKTPLIVIGIEEEAHIDKILPVEDGDNADGQMNNGPNARQAGFGQDHFEALYLQVFGLKRELHDVREDNNRLHEQNYWMMQQLSIRSIALQPVQRPQNEQAAAVALPGTNTATLSKNPRSIYILWQEFEFGIAGRKAAKVFTAE
jgi:hypothetical protein